MDNLYIPFNHHQLSCHFQILKTTINQNLITRKICHWLLLSFQSEMGFVVITCQTPSKYQIDSLVLPYLIHRSIHVLRGKCNASTSFFLFRIPNESSKVFYWKVSGAWFPTQHTSLDFIHKKARIWGKYYVKKLCSEDTYKWSRSAKHRNKNIQSTSTVVHSRSYSTSAVWEIFLLVFTSLFQISTKSFPFTIHSCRNHYHYRCHKDSQANFRKVPISWKHLQVPEQEGEH